MDLKLSGKTALVTGASVGIGRSIALGLAAEGVRVAIAARRGDKLVELAAEIKALGAPEACVIEADLYPDDASPKLAAAAIQARSVAGSASRCEWYTSIRTPRRAARNSAASSGATGLK